MTRTIRSAALLVPLLAACATPRPVPRPPGKLRVSVCNYDWDRQIRRESAAGGMFLYTHCFSGSYSLPEYYGGGGGRLKFEKCYSEAPPDSPCVTYVFEDLAAGGWAMSFKHGFNGREVQNVCYSLDVPGGGQAEAMMYWQKGGDEAGNRPVGRCKQR